MRNKAFEEIITTKAKRIMGSEDCRTYAKQLVDELGISEPQGAFMGGAIDAMIFDIALALDFEELQAGEYRKNLIKELWERERPAW